MKTRLHIVLKRPSYTLGQLKQQPASWQTRPRIESIKGSPSFDFLYFSSFNIVLPMASGFGPLGPRIRKTYVNSFQDHAGKPALTVFKSSSPLPFLYSFSIYFTHPDASPGNCHTAELCQTITQGPLYGSNVVEFRLDLYFIPGGSQEDCMTHYYRAEKSARGSFWTQVDAVGRDERPSDSNTKMPGLVPSYVHDKAIYRYHSLIYICDEADRLGGDQIMKCVEFDPLSREDYEKFSKDPEDPGSLTCSQIRTSRSRL